jgi:hypothetical protein
VEYQHGSTGPVLHVVDHHLAHSDLHPRRLTAQGASQQRGDNRGNTRRIDTERRTRSHVRQLEALGYKVTLAVAASRWSPTLDSHLFPIRTWGAGWSFGATPERCY